MRRTLLLSICCLGAVAHAGPGPQGVAMIQADVDGDGKVDQIIVRDNGSLTVFGTKTTASLEVPHPVTAAQISAAGPRIAAMIDASDGTHTGVAVELRGDKLVELWRGPVGPVGRDADYDVRIEATAGGLVRYQHKPGVERCDGAPARLFAETWDGGAWKPARPELAVPDAATEIAATDAKTFDAGLVYRASAASSRAGATDAGELAAPSAIDDGEVATAWSGAVDPRGEFFTYRAKMSGVRAAAVRIAHGARGRGRVTRVAIVGGGKAFWIKVPDSDKPMLATLPEPIASSCVSIVIGGARGSSAVSIGELAIVGDVELAPGGMEKALAASVAAGGTDGVTAARVLAGRGEAGARAVIEELDARGGMGGGDVATRRRLVAALIDNGAPIAAVPLAVALADGDISGGDAPRAVDKLATMGDDGLAALVKLTGDARVDVAVRAAAVHGLGVIAASGSDPQLKAAEDALIALAGDGDARLRRAVIDALAAHATVQRLIERAAASTGAKAGDVWRAAVIADRDGKLVRPLLRDVLAKGASYDERYRAIEGLAEGDDADVAAVGAAVKTLGDSAVAGALKSVAARGLGRNHRAPAAASLLLELAADGDPGVRLAAIGALASREPSGSSGAWVDPTPEAARDSIDRVIGTALAGDHWPEVRRASAAALGARCARPGPAAALGGAIDHDTDDDVRGDALAALVACHAAGVSDRLFAIADDDRASRGLRVRAIDLTVALGDASLLHGLEDRFARWRGAAFSDDVALDLAVHAAVALGRLGDRGALQALVDAAGDAAFPELQAAAATALGELAPCPPAVRQTLDTLTTSDQRNVALAARRARTRCTR
ncbi:MAG TPA: hypothetical protein VL463_16635 [Kofleriaceae bacterium]|nr:hypothetical protein [Kofleriaceae bacterium]